MRVSLCYPLSANSHMGDFRLNGLSYRSQVYTIRHADVVACILLPHFVTVISRVYLQSYTLDEVGINLTNTLTVAGTANRKVSLDNG